MRAAIIAEKAAPTRLGNFAEPHPAHGEQLIHVLAGSIGPTDLMRANGFFGPMPYPYVPGGEGVGRLDSGERVYFGHSTAPFGALAERTIVPQTEIWQLPDNIDDGLAIVLGISGTGALLPLEEAHIQAGESVLVLGAGRVVGTARNAAALARLTAHGIADATVQLGTGDDLAALKAQAGPGYNVVLDCIYGPPAETAIRATAPGARIMSIGIQAGPTVTLSLRDLVFRSHIGVGTGQRPAAERRAAFERLLAYGQTGRIKVDVTTHSLDDAEAAWTAQAQSPHAKVIIRP